MHALAAQMQRITQGDFSRVEPLDRNDEIGDLSRSVAKMTEWLGQSYETLEKRVQERTQALQKRTGQVQLSAQVSRDIASARSLEQLLENAVELVRERYGFYHAGIFLTDARGEYQVLRAATGEAGRQMLEKQHSLRIGQTGLVGHAAFSSQARVSTDVGQDVIHYKNPLLPETRSEAALPLIAGGHVIGVLDVQSQEPDAFDLESLSILQLMADQLAIAIQNARLVDEIQKNLADVQNAYGQLERQAWSQFFESNPNLGYSYDGVEIRALPAESPDIEDPAHTRGPFHLPLRVRGEEIGVLEVWPREDRFTEAEEYMLATLSSRLSQILESARLYEETRARASREEIINRLTATVARSLDLDGVLRSAALELGRLPGVREAAVVLDTATGKPKDTGPLDTGVLSAQPGRNGNKDGGSNGHRA
jgi:GAF domain-containing protein